MGRWTQYDEDSSRLPEGMKRIGYDADTQRYTFQDRNTGTIYLSAPGNAYGVLTPVSKDRSAQRVRPEAFASSDLAKEETKMSVNTNINSFDDFLPPNAITAPPSPPKLSMLSPSSPDSPMGSRLPDVFRKVRAMTSVVSRMQSFRSEDSGHVKSPSLPESSPPYRDSWSSPPMPSRRMRAYTKLPSTSEEEEKRALLRSKTMSSATSSRYSQHKAPARSTSRASQASTASTAYSTTSTVTPMEK